MLCIILSKLFIFRRIQIKEKYQFVMINLYYFVLSLTIYIFFLRTFNKKSTFIILFFKTLPICIGIFFKLSIYSSISLKILIFLKYFKLKLHLFIQLLILNKKLKFYKSSEFIIFSKFVNIKEKYHILFN